MCNYSTWVNHFINFKSWKSLHKSPEQKIHFKEVCLRQYQKQAEIVFSRKDATYPLCRKEETLQPGLCQQGSGHDNREWSLVLAYLLDLLPRVFLFLGRMQDRGHQCQSCKGLHKLVSLHYRKGIAHLHHVMFIDANGQWTCKWSDRVEDNTLFVPQFLYFCW